MGTDGAAAGDTDEQQGLRLAILDPHQLFRECLASALDRLSGFSVVRVSAPEAGAIESLDRVEPDVLVLGLDGPDLPYSALIRSATHQFPSLRTLVVGFAYDHGPVIECLEAGAKGCVFREQSLDEVVCAIEAVVEGKLVVTPPVAGSLFSRLVELGRRRRRRQRLERLTLTPRELEVLRLIADGLSNDQIAGRLCLSIHTIKNHVHRILETLGVHSRWDAARVAFRKGWLGRPQAEPLAESHESV
jgi:DNA-binding NarL/FixJ family response regulator